MSDQSKTCNVCGIDKNLDKYYQQIKKDRNGKPYIYYRPECKNCTKERSLDWASANREKFLNCFIKYNNKPEVKVKQNQAKIDHRKSGKYLEWQRLNKDKLQRYRKNREVKTHDITSNEWYNCRLFFNFRCSYCGKTWEQNKKETEKDLHKDHVVYDGRNDLKNCIPACCSCNSSKGERTLNDWYKSQEFYSRDRYLMIYQWLRYDVKKYIRRKKQRRTYSKKSGV